MCGNGTEDNKSRYESKQRKAKKVVSKALNERTETVLAELINCPGGMLFTPVW